MTLDCRGGRVFGRGGRGRVRGRGGQRQSRAPAGMSTAKKRMGLEAEITDNVFTYNEKGAADTL